MTGTATPPELDRRNDDPWRKKIEVQLDANTQMTLETKSRVDSVHDILTAAQGAFKVLGWISVAAKWIGIVAAAGSAAYVFYYQVTHGGDLPPK